MKANLYITGLDKVIACTQCGRKILFGDSYTSRHIHTVYGFGYAVCEKCYDKERKEEQGNG